MLPADLEARIDAAITHYPISKRSAVLPVLHLLQTHYRYLSEEAITWTATKLGLEPIQVLEVHIRVCRTLSCAMAGSYQVMDKLCAAGNIDRSHLSHHHPIAKSADGKYSIEFVECLASCGSAPVCLVEDDLHERIAPDKASELLARYA
jgi:NADH-quinone oxidoreductase subunit E